LVCLPIPLLTGSHLHSTIHPLLPQLAPPALGASGGWRGELADTDPRAGEEHAAPHAAAPHHRHQLHTDIQPRTRGMDAQGMDCHISVLSVMCYVDELYSRLSNSLTSLLCSKLRANRYSIKHMLWVKLISYSDGILKDCHLLRLCGT
jgi:hypothetical protein